MSTTGYRIIDSQGTLLGDGRPTALSTAQTLAAEAQSVATSFRLMPGSVLGKK